MLDELRTFYFFTKSKIFSITLSIVLLILLNVIFSYYFLLYWSVLIQQILSPIKGINIWKEFIFIAILYVSFKTLILIPLFYARDLVQKENELFNYNLYFNIPKNVISDKELNGKYAVDHYEISWILTYSMYILSALPDLFAILLLSYTSLNTFILLIVLYLFLLGIIFIFSSKKRVEFQKELSKNNIFIKGEFSTLIDKIRPIKMIRNFNFFSQIKTTQEKRTQLNSNIAFMNGLVHPYSLQIFLYIFIIMFMVFFENQTSNLVPIIGSFIIILPYITRITNSFFESLPLAVRLKENYLPIIQEYKNPKKTIFDPFDCENGTYQLEILHHKYQVKYEISKDRKILSISIPEKDLFELEANTRTYIKITDNQKDINYKMSPTETILLNDDIYKNVALTFDTKIDTSLVDYSLDLVYLNQAEEKSILYQGGSNLSGGEKSRLKIARVIYDNLKNINGFNVLFNPFRGIDMEMREKILYNLRKEEINMIIIENQI